MDAVATTLHIKRLDASSYFIPCVLARARDGCVGFGIHGDGSSCRAPPFFSPEAVWGV